MEELSQREKKIFKTLLQVLGVISILSVFYIITAPLDFTITLSLIGFIVTSFFLILSYTVFPEIVNTSRKGSLLSACAVTSFFVLAIVVDTFKNDIISLPFLILFIALSIYRFRLKD